jgi:hypothetical protein
MLCGVSRETGNRCVCYCGDCQSFAHFLDAHDGAPLSMGVRVTGIIKEAVQRGEQNRSAFFNAATGKPIVPVRILTAAELRDTVAARDEA